MVTVTTTAFDYIPENWTWRTAGSYSTNSTTYVDVIRQYDSATFELDVPNNYYYMYRMEVRAYTGGYIQLIEDGTTVIYEVNKGGATNTSAHYKSEFQNTSGSTKNYKMQIRTTNASYGASTNHGTIHQMSTSSMKANAFWVGANNTTSLIPLKLNINDFYAYPDKYDSWDLLITDGATTSSLYPKFSTMGISLIASNLWSNLTDTDLPPRIHESIRNNVLTTGLPIDIACTNGTTYVDSGVYIYWSGTRISVT